MQKKVAITVAYDSEKLKAIQKYAAKKGVDFDTYIESSLLSVLDKMFRSYVPKALREYFEEDAVNSAETVQKIDRKAGRKKAVSEEEIQPESVPEKEIPASEIEPESSGVSVENGSTRSADLEEPKEQRSHYIPGSMWK